MNFRKKTLFASFLIISASSAFAVDTADLIVTGVIQPAACTPSFSGGGVVDYGNIPSDTLSATAVTELETKAISYTITCDSPISLGTSWVDGRSGTANTSNIPAPWVAANSFGLGAQGTANIGRYLLKHSVDSLTGDGAPVDLITKDDGAAWNLSQTNGMTSNSIDRIHSYAAPGSLVPGTYSNISGVVNVTAAISPTSTLDMTNTITLDGLSTMTVRYL